MTMMRADYRRNACRLTRGVLAGALLAAGAVPAGAQQGDTVRMRIVRAVTPFEIKVEQLSRQLVDQASLSMALTDLRQRLRGTLERNIGDGERMGVESSLRRVEARLASVETDRANLKRALDELCAQRPQPDGWLGVAFSSTYTISSSPEGYGITHFKAYPSIETVEPGSPAERAGIQRGDILLNLAGRDLRDAQVVFGEMLKPGSRLALKLKRGVETKTVTVLIEPRPSDFEVPCAWVDETLTAAMRGPLPRTGARVPGPGSMQIIIRRPGTGEPGSGQEGFRYSYNRANGEFWAAGAQFIPLNRDLAELTEVDEGVFVVSVTSRTPAAQSGLRGGDVIVSAAKRAVTGPRQLLEIMEQSATKEVELRIIRMKKGHTVVLKW
jgi:membrane-associated protease RseP (regulator of RpoE activity)